MSDKSAPPATRGADLPEGLATRRAALGLLRQVLQDGRMLSDAPWLDGAQAARALRLAGLTLRWMGRADAVLRDRMARRPTPAVLDILRLALAERFAGDAAPHAVVHDAVALAKMSQRARRQAGLVNAVLRGVERADWDAAPLPRLPVWLRKQVVGAWGRARTEAIEAAHLHGAPLDLTAKADAARWADRLDGALLPTGSIRRDGGQVSGLAGYDTGEWWVQDAAAALPARLLGDVAGARVLDLCAAPGGKTMQLAAAGARVTAVDVSEGRLVRLSQNLARTGLSARLEVADGLRYEGGPFEAVMLDAPCTATGTIRRHPDLPHLRSARDVEALTRLQYQLLDRALTLVRPGGAVVFCTCSLLPVEGEHQVTAALKRHPGLTAVAPDPAAWGLPPAAASAHGLRLLPDLWDDRGGMDGFYMACLRTPSA